MDTNSNFSVQKKVLRVDILHLDELGYGPQGEHTRQQWRDECMDKLLAGKHIYKIWQEDLKKQIRSDLKLKSFECKLTLSDGTVKSVLSSIFIKKPPYALDYTGCIFQNEISISDYEFYQVALFSGASFTREVAFNRTIFTEDTFFRDATFHEETAFSGTRFYGEVYLNDSNFIKTANFNNAIFNKSANFEKVFFGDVAVFEKVKFSGVIMFLDFNESIFTKKADFNNSIFKSVADFSNIKIYDEVDFKSCTFFESVHFGKIIFNGDANFEYANFKGGVGFDDAEFRKNCFFRNSIFETFCHFKYVTFENIGHFENTIFKTQFPRFLGCKIDQTRLEFSENCKFPSNDYDDGVLSNISFLKRLADEHGQSDQALMFNAIELSAKREQARIKIKSWSFFKKIGNSDFWFANATVLYDKLSDYGRSFTRPLIAYVSIFVITYFLAILFAANSAPIKCTERMFQYNGDIQSDSPVSCLSYSIPQTDPAKDDLKLTGYRAAFEYAAYRASGIFDFSDNGKATDVVTKRVFGAAIEPWWMRVWGIFKSFASIALLFLAALGLRNKYRIK